MTTWRDVLTPSKVGGYFVRPTYRSAVKSICKNAAHTENYICSGATPLTGDIEARCWEWFLLDGFARDGYWPWYHGLSSEDRHFANGLRLLSTEPDSRCRRLVRYVLYHLDVAQPRRFPREARIPTLQELEAEVEGKRWKSRRRRASNAGSSSRGASSAG